MAKSACVNQNNLHEVRDAFAKAGVSVSAWAEANGFSRAITYQVLHGRIAGVRGQGFQIAVALGLRKATPMTVDELSHKLASANLEEKK
jgi:gp16 family phage-associated protein